jgi:hypothetical protein
VQKVGLGILFAVYQINIPVFSGAFNPTDIQFTRRFLTGRRVSNFQQKDGIFEGQSQFDPYCGSQNRFAA